MSADKLSKFREVLRSSKVDAFLVPSGDAHQSEYIAACDGRRGFISGFTGSAGYAIVTTEKAALWTDGRYFLQAEKQLGSQWTLMKDGLLETPTRIEWLKSGLKPGSKVAFDPQLHTIDEVKELKKSLSKLSLVPVKENLVDKVWTGRPARPSKPLLVHELKYAGKSHSDKIAGLRDYLKGFKSEAKDDTVAQTEATGFLVTALDEVCWLLNLRGSDIPFNPVFFAYCLVTTTESILFTDSKRVDQSVLDHLRLSNTQVKPYEAVFEEISKLGKTLKTSTDTIQKLLVGETGSVAVLEALAHDEHLEVVKSPVQKEKAIKNSAELEGFRQCHLRDAAALCNFFGWIENELLVLGNASISECDAADKAEFYRSQQSDYMGLSFDTISSTGPNGAIIHYKPEKGTCANIDKSQVYLCDSGGQYKDGTTDVTRTLHFTTPSDFEKLAFTRVLQGHIALDTVVYPEGTTGYILDPFARSPLWKSGLNYRHGTGHGVGSFLNVHEGPHGIGLRKGYDNVPLSAGMTVTNEPGYYHDGHFGIRIENVLLVKEVETPHKFGGKKHLGFEHVTFVPLGRNLIEKSLLSEAELKWINSYHKECREKVLPLLQKDSLGYKWLLNETQEI